MCNGWSLGHLMENWFGFSQDSEFLIRGLSEHSLEVRVQVAVSLGDGIQGGFGSMAIKKDWWLNFLKIELLSTQELCTPRNREATLGQFAMH